MIELIKDSNGIQFGTDVYVSVGEINPDEQGAWVELIRPDGIGNTIRLLINDTSINKTIMKSADEIVLKLTT